MDRNDVYDALIPLFNQSAAEGNEPLHDEIGDLLDIVWKKMTAEERRRSP